MTIKDLKDFLLHIFNDCAVTVLPCSGENRHYKLSPSLLACMWFVRSFGLDFKSSRPQAEVASLSICDVAFFNTQISLETNHILILIT